ncbi:uncharacterized protein LOC135366794 [Ornithodoros turicata]|uniref:uncharacterized protein LOC135366794 n=1 Tax=Ornithodoros turicata TaxID=34597 RepID=UPI00313900B7
MPQSKDDSYKTLSQTMSSMTNAVTAKETMTTSNEEYVTAPERPLLARDRSIPRPPRENVMSSTSSTMERVLFDRTNSASSAAVAPPDWTVFCHLFVLYLAIISTGLSLHAWYSAIRWHHATTSCTSQDCDDLRGYLDTVGNLSAEPCDDFYEYVCGRATTSFRYQQERSVYQSMNHTLLETPRHVFPERSRKLVDYYHACYGTLMNPQTLPEDFTDFIVYLNLSMNILRSENTTALLRPLLVLAVTRRAVPAIRVFLDDHAPVVIDHGVPLATILKSALESGSITKIASAAMGTPVLNRDLVDALALDTYEDSEITGPIYKNMVQMNASEFFKGHSEFLCIFHEVIVEYLEERNMSSPDPVLQIHDPKIVIRNVARLWNARPHALALYTVMCATSELILTETLKRDVYQRNPVWTCLEDIRRPMLLNDWNGLVWTSVQPWAKEQSLRALFASMREQLRKAIQSDISPRIDQDTKILIDEATKRISLSFVQVHNDTQGGNLPSFHRLRYYRNRDTLRTFLSREKEHTSGDNIGDLATLSIHFNPAMYQTQVTPGVLVPPLFSTNYSPFIQAAGLGFLIAATIVSSVANPVTWPVKVPDLFVNISNCLLDQAGMVGDNVRYVLFNVAQGLRLAALTQDRRPPKDKLMTEHAAIQEELRWREDRRLFYRMSCSVFCMDVVYHIPPHELCHAAIGNSLDFYWLFGCNPSSRMARRGVCALG